jgi:putative ABC transport system permease protein
MRWLKLFRDARTESGRLAVLLGAVAFALLAVTAMLSAYGIVTREVGINYQSTNPASATIEVDRVTPEFLATARAFPGIADAEARSVIEARVKVADEWMRMLLFVVDDFATMRLNLFKPLSGAWPPADGTMLIERQAAGVIGAAEGGSVTVKTPRGQAAEIPVTGIVHDTTLAPAWQEQSGYGYLSTATLALLGEPPVLDELRILVAGNPSMAEIDARALALAELLKSQGADVHAVKVPPPGKHPHQGQITTGLLMFLSMAVLALLLAAVLAAAVLAATLARQAREIAVMKAIGARGAQIAVMYAVLLLALGAAALVIAVPLGVVAGQRLSELMADTMNFVITGHAVPAWVYAVVVGSGLLMPLLAASPAITRASRVTVREALAASGAGTSFGSAGFERLLAALGGFGLSWLLALRNAFRRRGRLILALAMLATGGGLFITALSVRDGWRELAATALADRKYDIEFMFAEPVPVATIASTLAPIAGIGSFEPWGYEQTAFAAEGRIDVMRTYPDRGHGSFALYGVPPATAMISFPMIEGRWLAENDTDAVVLTQQNHRQAETPPKLGERISLSVGGRPAAFTVVGIMREIGGGGAYVPKRSYDALVSGDAGRIVRIAFAENAAPTLVAEIEAALTAAGLAVERTAPLTTLYAALVGHVEVPVRMLIAAAVLLGLIGGLGLASMMTVNVLERTRELGIMKAIGAAPGTLVRIVLGEAVAVAAMSWPIALAIAAPLVLAIGSMARGMFGTPLPFTLSTVAALAWLATIVVIALVAAAGPAVRASKLIVRQALAYT